MHLDPRFERIARRLTAADLRADDDDDDDGLDLMEARTGRRFVDAYSTAGLRRALDEYGITAALVALGLADHELRISADDPFRHQLRIVLADGRQVMDLRLHLVDAAVDPVADPNRVSVVVVDWLSMQNPRASFSAQRPRLPGQEHPGTGLGRTVHQLLVLLCRRIGRDALITVPERFHLAVLYRKAGYVCLDADVEAVLIGVERAGAAAGLSLAELAWAVERGYVHADDDDATVFVHAPVELVFPVSPRLERGLARRPQAPIPAFVVDVEALRSSLAKDPVDGLVP
ncbi:MAG: hypothetical protein Q8O67_22475 [Deltaproteobacteria bacterium]|nr:hypothetical protein [Deltaproteobacteria bacterium]